MEFADSHAMHLRFSRIIKQWLKWAEKETFAANRIKAEAKEMLQHFI